MWRERERERKREREKERERESRFCPLKHAESSYSLQSLPLGDTIIIINKPIHEFITLR